MSYWWVSQNKTYEEEKAGGYLWAPKSTESGKAIYHWETMKDVRKGDIIFSYYRRQIVAFSTALESAVDSKKPFKSDGDWQKEGRKISVSYSVLSRPINKLDIVEELQELLRGQSAHKPLNVHGDGCQGYLFPLTDEAGNFLLSQCKSRL